MDFRLLGPVSVWEADAPVPIGGTKPRTLLAALLLEHGQVVPARRLVDVIWGDEPPETATSLVQTYVSSLRRALTRPDRDDVIRTRPPGYVLRTGPDEIDQVVFQRLAEEGRQASRAGRHEQAGQRFRAALALWRGPALGGIGDSPLAAKAAWLEDMRLAVLEECAAADLAIGRYEQLVAELTALVAGHPAREMLRRHLMVALYGMDRRADALAVYRDGRRVLIDEVGVEPGPALQAAHEAILRSDRSILAEPANQPKAQPEPLTIAVGPAVPAQLPPVPVDFTGRATQIADLVARLSPGDTPTGVPTCVLSGQGGSGKTTLAVRVAHQVAAAYPDGQLFVQLHGMTETPVAPETVLGRFLGALGLAPGDLPGTVEERVALYRSQMARRRILVVLDDAASEQQVRPLLPGSPTCAVLITARGRLAGLAGAHLGELEVFDPSEAGELLASIAGADRVAAEPAAARRLVDQAGRLPLAVRIVGVRLATRRHWSLAQLSTRLGDEARRLDELTVGDQEVRATVAMSYRALDPGAQTALRRLGLLGVPDFPTWVVAALLDSADADADAEDAIEQLLDAKFLEYARTDGVGQPRYQLHDLLRIYAQERALAEEDPEVGRSAVRRVLLGWLRLVEQIVAENPAGGLLLRTGRVDGGWQPPVSSARALADPRAWFEAEQHALVASVERAAAMDLADLAGDLASALSGSLFARDNLFDAWSRTHEAALAAVRRAGNRLGEARLLAELGQLRYKQDRFAEARTYFLQALAVFRECHDARGEAATLAALATASREQGYLPEALHFVGLADEVFRELGDEAATAYSDRLVGLIRLEEGDYPAAHRHFHAALEAFRRLGSRRGEGMVLRTVAMVHRALGEYEPAYEVSEQARAIFREVGDDLLEAYGKRSVGKALVRLGRGAEAIEQLDEALRTSRAHADRWGEAMTLRTLGELHLAGGRWAEAEEHLQASLRIWQAIDLPVNRARTLRDLSRLSRARGDAAAAHTLRTEAMEIFQRYGVREAAELAVEEPV